MIAAAKVAPPGVRIGWLHALSRGLRVIAFGVEKGAPGQDLARGLRALPNHEKVRLFVLVSQQVRFIADHPGGEGARDQFSDRFSRGGRVKRLSNRQPHY